MINLKNKTIIITGASQGIGKEIAKTCAKFGSNLVLLSRNKFKLKKIVDNIKAHNNQQIIKY